MPQAKGSIDRCTSKPGEAVVYKTDQAPTLANRAKSRGFCQNLPIATLSWRVPIHCFPTRSRHNLLHQRNELRAANFRAHVVPLCSD